MTLSTVAVLRPGDWVRYDGSEHQVLALAGTSVRLRTVDGADSVVLAVHLMASPGFAVVDSEPAPSVEPFALLDSLPGAVLDTAREWERHVVEIETGLPPGAEPGVAPKPEYDPTSTTVVDRDRAKAAELGVGVRTVQTRRARYAQQGLWGLVDQRAVRAWEATGRADARLAAAAREVIDAETDTSTGTRSRLIRRVTKAVEATYGPGVVPMPARTTFYRLIDALATGRRRWLSNACTWHVRRSRLNTIREKKKMKVKLVAGTVLAVGLGVGNLAGAGVASAAGGVGTAQSNN
jgi:putative transposase